MKPSLYWPPPAPPYPVIRHTVGPTYWLYAIKTNSWSLLWTYLCIEIDQIRGLHHFENIWPDFENGKSWREIQTNYGSAASPPLAAAAAAALAAVAACCFLYSRCSYINLSSTAVRIHDGSRGALCLSLQNLVANTAERNKLMLKGEME